MNVAVADVSLDERDLFIRDFTLLFILSFIRTSKGFSHSKQLSTVYPSSTAPSARNCHIVRPITTATLVPLLPPCHYYQTTTTTITTTVDVDNLHGEHVRGRQRRKVWRCTRPIRVSVVTIRHQRHHHSPPPLIHHPPYHS